MTIDPAQDASGKEHLSLDIRPWSEGDLPLLERLMGDATMTE